jgi:predicted O-methyltransferase YrrM
MTESAVPAVPTATPIPYTPRSLFRPARLLDVPTAWNGVESVLLDVIQRFRVRQRRALEFGVDYGYSTSALANFFDQVLGVDTFTGDAHAGFREEEMYERVRANFEANHFDNVILCKDSFEQFTTLADFSWDLIHIDIFHEYAPTLAAARWAVAHSHVVLLHDTRAFPDVMRACCDLTAEEILAGRPLYFYEWDQCHGLGILSRREVDLGD